MSLFTTPPPFLFLMINIKLKTSELGYYLAGLIEGDGNIWIPKAQRSFRDELWAPSIAITFHKKELPLFELIKSVIGGGYIYKSKSDNSCRYRIVKLEILIKVIYLINGKFRTPKINSLHQIIDFINLRHNLCIEKLPLDNSSLGSNSWLSGFTDADGNFYIALRGRYSTNPNNKYSSEVRCYFNITQRIIDKLTKINCTYFMTEIAEFFTCKLYVTNYNIINITVSNIDKLNLINIYFEKYPLFTSKYLNYLSYLQGLNYVKQDLSYNEIIEIQSIKNNMNKKRIYFNWDHLKNFYNL